jgi:Zn-dependent peptidase ImmA (M78 family)
MKIPKKINLCGHTYEVIYKKQILMDGRECYGLCDIDKHVIYLKTGMAETQRMDVLLHECIHAIEGIFGLNLTETAVNNLAIGLLSLIRENKLNFLEKGK